MFFFCFTLGGNMNKGKRIIIILLLFIFFCCISYLILDFSELFRENQEMIGLLNSIEIDEETREEVNEEINEDDIKDTKPEVTERMLKVRELKKENQDVIGWLEIEDTNINYPVMQASEEEDQFYLTHNYKREENKQGSLYLEEEYDWSIPSNNFLIFGHNNSLDGSMFADLPKYEDESFYQEHPTIRFTTVGEDAEYEIISAFRSRLYYKNETGVFRYYFFYNCENEEEYNEFVRNAKDSSLYDTGKTAKYGDQLITLSTCAYHTEDGRFAVVARKQNSTKSS